MGDDSVQLAPTTGINLEKVDTSKPCLVDENFAVLLGKCSNTKKTYLVKYAKRIAGIEGLEELGIKGLDYKLVGAYPVDEETYNSYLRKYQDRSFYDTKVKVNDGDNILILQTCSNKAEYASYKKKYLLVIAKEIREVK